MEKRYTDDFCEGSESIAEIIRSITWLDIAGAGFFIGCLGGMAFAVWIVFAIFGGN